MYTLEVTVFDAQKLIQTNTFFVSKKFNTHKNLYHQSASQSMVSSWIYCKFMDRFTAICDSNILYSFCIYVPREWESKFDRPKTREYREKFVQPLYENTLQFSAIFWKIKTAKKNFFFSNIFKIKATKSWIFLCFL